MVTAPPPLPPLLLRLFHYHTGVDECNRRRGVDRETEGCMWNVGEQRHIRLADGEWEEVVEEEEEEEEEEGLEEEVEAELGT